MKRKLLILAIVLSVLVAGQVMAQELYMRPTAVKTADAALLAAPCLLHGLMFVTDGTNAVTINVYDNASAASGTKLVPTSTVITTSASNRVQAINFSPPLNCENGVYVDITTAGTVAYMGYYTSR